MKGSEYLMNNRIKEYRKKRKMSQQDLADAIGVTRVSIYNIENKVGECKLSTAFAIADALGVKITTLFF